MFVGSSFEIEPAVFEKLAGQAEPVCAIGYQTVMEVAGEQVSVAAATKAISVAAAAVARIMRTLEVSPTK